MVKSTELISRIIISQVIIPLLILGSLCNAQSVDSTKVGKLQDIGFYPYPSSTELANNLFNDSLMQSTPLSVQDIDTNFSNTEDLEWLQPVALRNKAILLGEEHYSQYIANIRNRIFFYLNTVDYYSLLVMENQYSYTGFYNYYINMQNDAAAEKYFQETLHPMVTNDENMALLHHVRSWNKRHPSKKLTIGFSDVEHDFQTTIRKILIPYFQTIDQRSILDTNILSFKELGAAIPRLRRLQKIAQERNVVGAFPFLTADYIKNVIDNLESTYKAYYFEFSFYRQKAIIHNLTDKKFFGKYFETSKVFLYGGNYHMPSHFTYPDGGNFYREGSFLSQDYRTTKGRVYSINIHCFSRFLGRMAAIDVDSCLTQGSNYYNMVRHWQTAYKQKLIDGTDVVFEFKMNDLHRLIVRRSEMGSHHAIAVSNMNWKEILKTAQAKEIMLYNDLKGWAEDYPQYDTHIFIAASPFSIARIR